MRSWALCSVLAVAPVLAAAPACADPARQVAAAPAEQTVFEICRISGAGADVSDRTIEIPAGSEFAPDMSPAEDPAAPGGPSPPPLAIITTQAASIPVDRYCVSVPVKPFGGSDDRALDATVGDMFVPAGNPQQPLTFDPLGLTYGYLKSKNS